MLRCELTSYMEPQVTTLLSIPTTWRRNTMTIDTVKIMTSPQPFIHRPIMSIFKNAQL